MSRALSDMDRRLGNILQIGRVTEISAEAGTARVQIGDLKTPMIPVAQLRAGVIKFHWMPSAGEQVLVGAPSGDIAQAVVIMSIFANNAPGSNAARPVIDIDGGTLEVNGSIELTGDVTASGISLVHHTHGGVTPGPANTGEPNG